MTNDSKKLNEMDEEILAKEDGNNDDDEAQTEEEEKERRKKAMALWRDVQSGNTNHLITRVASILNRFPETRNSDVALMIKYWQVYQDFTGDTVELKALFELERLTSIARARAKIQNEYRLFGATRKIRGFRHDKEKREKEFQLLTKPEIGSISIYADESGKNEDFLLVGSIWLLADEGFLYDAIMGWLKEKEEEGTRCPREFHFSDIRNNGTNIEIYKEFIDFVLSQGSMISFKGIAVNRTKIRKPLDEILTHMFYQLARLGVEHELNVNRFTLPRQINYTKELEEGESSLRLKQIEQMISDGFKSEYNDQLILNFFHSLEAKLSRLIQIADLFTASLNRIYNIQRKNRDLSKNAKDEFAEHLINSIGLTEINNDISQYNSLNSNQFDEDMATIYIFD